MKPGDLRRFREGIMMFTKDYQSVSGRTFMVLESRGPARPLDEQRVDILMDGRVESGWSFKLVHDRSEPINEAR